MDDEKEEKRPKLSFLLTGLYEVSYNDETGKIDVKLIKETVDKNPEF